MKHSLVRLGEVSLALVLLASTSCSSSGGDATVSKPKADAGKSSGDDSADDSDDTTGDDSTPTNGHDAGPVEGGVIDAGNGKTCPVVTSYVEGTKISLAVTWKAAAAINDGAGTISIWLLTKFTGSGNTFTGESRTCRIQLPDIALSGAGQLATGGKTVRLNFDDALWNAATMPITKVAYTQKGNDPKSTFSVAPSTTLIGIKLDDAANFTWPDTAWKLPGGGTPDTSAFPDQDGDKKPGISSGALEDQDAGIVLPPIGLGAGGSQANVDKVYIVSRIGVALDGTKDTCSTQHGTAKIPYFDNHVVGCRIHSAGSGSGLGIKAGDDCTTGGGTPQSAADFVDQSRTVYVPGDATFKGVQLTDDSNCAAVITNLP